MEVFLRFVQLLLSPWSRLRVRAPDTANGRAGSCDDEGSGKETHSGLSSSREKGKGKGEVLVSCNHQNPVLMYYDEHE